MLGATLIRRVRGGVMAGILSTKAPAAAAAGSRSMSIWSDMPMGPPDPILGLTGQSRAGALLCRRVSYVVYVHYFFVFVYFSYFSQKRQQWVSVSTILCVLVQ